MACNIIKKILVGSSSPFLNKSIDNLLIFLNVEWIRQSKLLFFVCNISDLYLFWEIFLLNSCFIFAKNLILLIEKAAAGT